MYFCSLVFDKVHVDSGSYVPVDSVLFLYRSGFNAPNWKYKEIPD